MDMKPACDLCGAPTWETLFDGEEFGLEGRICKDCREALLEERARLRFAKLARLTYTAPYRRGPTALYLDVLDPVFGWDDLTARAAVRVILSDPATRRVFRRRRGVVNPGNTVAPDASTAIVTTAQPELVS